MITVWIIWTDIKTKTCLRCHIETMWVSVKCTLKKEKRETDSKGWRKTPGWSLSSDIWMKTKVSTHSRERNRDRELSYRQLERNSNHHGKCAFYSVWTCSWCVVGYGVRRVWISWRSVWRKPLQVRCVVVTALRESENSALLLSFILTGLFIWVPTSNWQDLDLSNVCFWSDRNQKDQ